MRLGSERPCGGDVMCDNKNLCGGLTVHQAFHSFIPQTLIEHLLGAGPPVLQREAADKQACF